MYHGNPLSSNYFRFLGFLGVYMEADRHSGKENRQWTPMSVRLQRWKEKKLEEEKKKKDLLRTKTTVRKTELQHGDATGKQRSGAIGKGVKKPVTTGALRPKPGNEKQPSTIKVSDKGIRTVKATTLEKSIGQAKPRNVTNVPAQKSSKALDAGGLTGGYGRTPSEQNSVVKNQRTVCGLQDKGLKGGSVRAPHSTVPTEELQNKRLSKVSTFTGQRPSKVSTFPGLRKDSSSLQKKGPSKISTFAGQRSSKFSALSFTSNKDCRSHQPKCVAVKPTLKRRYSDLHTSNNQTKDCKKRAVSILKRKSCLPSIPSSAVPSWEGEVVSKGEESGGAVCQTPGRNVRFTSPEVKDDQSHTQFRKTPSKKTQESIRNKLNDWLKAKGKTPSKFRHLMCFDAHLSGKKKQDPKAKRSLTVDELTLQQKAMEQEEDIVMNLDKEFSKLEGGLEHSSTDEGSGVSVISVEDRLDSMIEECMILYEAGCPIADILSWLDQIEENIEVATTSAKFYICKAKVQQASSDAEKVLQVFETAVRNNAKPTAELASSLTEIIKDVIKEKEKQAHNLSSLQKQVEESNIFQSSAIRYVVKQVTPFSKRRHKSVGAVTSPTTSCAVVTPVRRSTRRSLADLPEALHDKTPVYNRLEDISSEDRKRTLYLPNTALDLENDG